jgi:pilus assembly protein CpaB
MSTRTVLVIFLAIGCGLSAALGLNLVLASGRGTADGTVETAPVVVAKAEIPRGRLVSAALVEVKAWPKSLIPTGALAKPEDSHDRAALQTMLPGEPLFEAKLAAKGVIGGMASLIPAGQRGYTIQTKTQASNVAGFVLPGNLVDVLLTFRSNSTDDTGGGSTTTLLQAVEVLAVGKSIDSAGTATVKSQDIESVTLLVTPEQATRLDLGQSLGMLSLSLRNPNDQAEAETTPATIADIRFGQMKPVTDSRKMMGLLGSLATSVRGALATLPTSAPSARPTATPFGGPATTPVLTLRGQTWGSVRMIIPDE